MNKHPLFNILEKQKQGIPKGICSVCSANEFVLEATMKKGKNTGDYILIEATCNQVNQFGGYTGMKPMDFKDFVYRIAENLGFSKDKIILAGDHLGPNPWKNEKAEIAMEKSLKMIELYVEAGFTKIHLDASMHLGDDDKTKPLDSRISAERSALMAKVAEESFIKLKSKTPESLPPVYVIGTEVPIPGGQQEKDEEIKVTTIEDFRITVDLTWEAFIKNGLEEAWERVIAVVVQPGVEFGHEDVIEYSREKAKELVEELKKYNNLVFEGHSTDYQRKELLKELVEDGVGILKVGPALTFAVREALFSLSKIEKELYKYDFTTKESNFIEVLDMIMLEQPKDWNSHYHGNEKDCKLARKYSFSDRSRYYYLIPQVKEAMDILIKNLEKKEIPKTLLSQYMPIQYQKVREGSLKNSPKDLVIDSVTQVLDLYEYACYPK